MPRYEQLTYRERPVAIQHSLRNNVDHMAALSHAYATTKVEAED